MEFGDYKLNEMWQEFLFMANLMSYEINPKAKRVRKQLTTALNTVLAQ